MDEEKGLVRPAEGLPGGVACSYIKADVYLATECLNRESLASNVREYDMPYIQNVYTHIIDNVGTASCA